MLFLSLHGAMSLADQTWDMKVKTSEQVGSVGGRVWVVDSHGSGQRGMAAAGRTSYPLMVINKKPSGGPDLQVACLMVQGREKISANKRL